MKVIVFGATGTVGRLAVNEVLAAGHEVTAFARSPEKLDLTAPKLHRVSGDALNADDVQKAVAGHDAVIVALGAGMSRKSKIRSQGTMNVIRAMQANGVKRLVVQSTLGAHESWSNLNFFWKRIMFGGIIRPVFKDHELQEQIVRASGLDWTIVRPSAFTDGPAKGGYKIGFGPQVRDLALKISRADVAGYLAKQLADRSFLHRAVGISY